MSGERSTIIDMPVVYRRGTRGVFHKTAGCVQLNKAPARGVANPITEIDLAELDRPRPCKVCYADAPRPRFARRYCPLCNKSRTYPCEHNGGVLVTFAYQTKYIGLLRDPGEEMVVTKWVWPEKAHLYEPIAS